MGESAYKEARMKLKGKTLEDLLEMASIFQGELEMAGGIEDGTDTDPGTSTGTGTDTDTDTSASASTSSSDSDGSE